MWRHLRNEVAPIQLDDLNADPNLYVRYELPPTLDDYDERDTTEDALHKVKQLEQFFHAV